ncbi:MAG: hypothetical protein AB1595_04140 [bacterium]
MGEIIEFISLRNGRKVVTKKTTLEDKSFDKDFWKCISPSEKLACAWQMVIDTAIIKKKQGGLKLKKIINIYTTNGKHIKTIRI